MQANFFEPEEGQQYDKKVVNVIINPAIEAENTKRVYSTMDLYPTTLGALGAKIEGNRLGLGTNLFSNEKTLIEKYGVEGKVIYACGPMPMLKALAVYAEEHGMEAQISLEERMACGIGACLGCICKTKEKGHHTNVNNTRICKDGPVFLATEVEI